MFGLQKYDFGRVYLFSELEFINATDIGGQPRLLLLELNIDVIVEQSNSRIPIITMLDFMLKSS